METVKRRPGRPRKHDLKLVPITGYITMEERARLDQIVSGTGGSYGEWVADAIRSKLAK